MKDKVGLADQKTQEFYLKLLDLFSESKAPFYRTNYVSYSYTHNYAIMCRLNEFLNSFKKKKIAVFTDKSIAAYSAIYAILLSGNCWVPLEPSHPTIWILDMIKLSDPAVILIDRDLPKAVQKYAIENEIEIVRLDRFLVGEGNREFDVSQIQSNDLAYIMFTSGSTGVPKGVPISHANLIGFVEATLEVLPIKKGDVFADYHDFGFDLSLVYLMCCPMIEGAFAPALDPMDRILPVNHLRNNNVTILISVPSLISRLIIYARGREIELPVRLVLLAGEEFRLDQLAFAYDSLKPDNVYNFYGLTETAVENFYHKCSPEDVKKFENIGSVPIGLPLSGNAAQLSESGELMLAGVQVTSGYLGGVNPEKFCEIDGVTWFRTGDRAELIEGLYFCKGRFDYQVKVNGYRIELLEIETKLRGLAEINEAICFVTKNQSRSYLVAALLISGDVDTEAIRKKLSKVLPDYMVPADYFVLEDLPLSNSGKIDRGTVERMYGL